MAERGILFSAPMVRAILAGTKSQTRRVVKPPPHHVSGGVPFGDAPAWARAEAGSAVMRCPYGRRGDRLWVRETYFAFGRWETRFSAKKGRDEWHFVDMTVETGRAYQFVAPAEYVKAAHNRGSVTPTWWKRPAIFMPRRASRITLEVTGVRVERLQDISRGDAMEEGCPFANMAQGPDPRNWYRDLWESINGAGSWDANPWVWVVEFRRAASKSSEP